MGMISVDVGDENEAHTYATGITAGALIENSHGRRAGAVAALMDGVERDLAEQSSFANSYAAGGRVDLRLVIDALGELYLLTKGDGWVRKLVPLNN